MKNTYSIGIMLSLLFVITSLLNVDLEGIDNFSLNARFRSKDFTPINQTFRTENGWVIRTLRYVLIMLEYWHIEMSSNQFLP